MTKERLAAYDRPITHDPAFSRDQAPSLKRDLTAYLATLRARPLPGHLASLGTSPAADLSAPH